MIRQLVRLLARGRQHQQNSTAGKAGRQERQQAAPAPRSPTRAHPLLANLKLQLVYKRVLQLAVSLGPLALLGVRLSIARASSCCCLPLPPPPVGGKPRRQGCYRHWAAAASGGGRRPGACRWDKG